jgi:hypothetical protein
MLTTIRLSDIDIDLSWNTRDPGQILPGGILNNFNPADLESEGVEGLMRNILANGQLTPVDVRKVGDGFYKETSKPYSLVTGFRRASAIVFANGDAALRELAEKEGRTIVPGLTDGCIHANVHGPMSERAAFLFNVAENANREGLSTLETYALVRRGFEQLRVPVKELALQLGKSEPAVYQYVRLSRLPPDVIAHWTGQTELFEGKRYSRKPISVRDLLLILAKWKGEEEQRASYLRLLQHDAPGSTKAERPAFERARDRAAASGTMLGRLGRAHGGRIDVRTLEWAQEVPALANTTKQWTWAETEALASAARGACARELDGATTTGREPPQ